MKQGKNEEGSAVKQQDVSFDKGDEAGKIYAAQHQLLQDQMETLQQQLHEKHAQEQQKNLQMQQLFGKLTEDDGNKQAVQELFGSIYGSDIFQEGNL
jgi:flagellar biosynthesis chaperone FliJ